MNQRIREQLSALMDGELEAEQLRFMLAGLAADKDAAHSWGRYQLAAQVLRREHPAAVDGGLAEAVMAAITAETPAARMRPGQRVLRWGAGGAIAASVALLALLATRPPAQPGSVLQAPLAQSTPAVVSRASTIAAMPATATSTSYGVGEVRPPLLLPNAPLDAAPASYGSEAALMPTLDPRLGVYARGVPSGQVASGPYVLLIAPVERAARSESARRQ